MRYENLEILDSLIEKGANLNSIDAFNCTPLIIFSVVIVVITNAAEADNNPEKNLKRLW